MLELVLRAGGKLFASARSEVERNVHLPESFFLFLQVAVAQFIKAATRAKIFQKRIYLLEQLGIPFAHADGPRFFLKRLEDRARGILVTLPVFEGGHLIVDK